MPIIRLARLKVRLRNLHVKYSLRQSMLNAS
jgi:hypothetical protein